MSLPQNKFLLPLSCLILLCSCSSRDQQEQGTMHRDTLKEKLIRANKTFVRIQLNDIDRYISQKGYLMDSTETGLRYRIQHMGGKEKPDESSTVTIRYITSLLDGTECYRSDSTGEMKFSMSYDDVLKGLREGVSMMHRGDKALFILPAHLAYGLTGDGNKVPSNAALVMQVELAKIE